MKISQNVVAFSEYMNFNWSASLICLSEAPFWFYYKYWSVTKILRKSCSCLCKKKSWIYPVQRLFSEQSKTFSVKSMREENKFLSLLRFDGKFLSASTKVPSTYRLYEQESQIPWSQTNCRTQWDNMGYYLIAAVSLVILTTAVRIPSAQGTHHPDRFCVRNFGCDTDFQDMALGVSLFLKLSTKFCMKVIN